MVLGQRVDAVSFGGLAEQLKTIWEVARNLGVPMLAGTANAAARLEGSMLAKRQSTPRDVVPERDRFLGEIQHHAEANGVIKFVHVSRVIRGLAGRAALQDDDVQGSARAELFCHEQSSPPPANDDGVDSEKRPHDSSSLGRTFEPVVWPRLMGLGRNGLP